MYPKLPELIRYLKSLKQTKSIFLVTNGQEPDMIKKMADEDALPTQLYLSTNAADSESFIKINRPKYKDSWERWNKTLGMLKDLDTRTVLRLTIIRDHNNDSESAAFVDRYSCVGNASSSAIFLIMSGSCPFVTRKMDFVCFRDFR